MKRFVLEPLSAPGARVLVFTAAVLLLNGCAVHYRNATTGVEHVWGFGHLQMKTQVEPGRPQAVVSGIETAGLTVGLGDGGYYLNLGVNRRNVTEVAREGADVRVEWPAGNFYQMKVDSATGRSAEKDTASIQSHEGAR